MPSDAWADLNRRAAAVPGGVPWEGGASGVWDDGAWRAYESGKGLSWCTSGCGYIARLLPAVMNMVPNMRDAATRGILRAALGSPSIRLERLEDGEWWAQVSSYNGVREHREVVRARGATREEAEAAALVALAEARQQWGPG